MGWTGKRVRLRVYKQEAISSPCRYSVTELAVRLRTQAVPFPPGPTSSTYPWAVAGRARFNVTTWRVAARKPSGGYASSSFVAFLKLHTPKPPPSVLKPYPTYVLFV